MRAAVGPGRRRARGERCLPHHHLGSLVDFRGDEGRASSVRVVEQHDFAVRVLDLRLRGALSDACGGAGAAPLDADEAGRVQCPGESRGRAGPSARAPAAPRICDASLRLILASKPHADPPRISFTRSITLDNLRGAASALAGTLDWRQQQEHGAAMWDLRAVARELTGTCPPPRESQPLPPACSSSSLDSSPAALP